MIQKQILTKFAKYNYLILGKKEISIYEKEDGSILDSEIPSIVKKFIPNPEIQIHYLQQTHGTDVIEIVETSSEVYSGDAYFTKEFNHIMVVKTADCIPIFFWNKRNPLCGVIHSGWKGTQKQIAPKLFSYLLGQDKTIELELFLGPSIRQKNYEIEDDVASLFRDQYPESLLTSGNKFLFGNDIVLKKDLSNFSFYLEDSNVCNREDNDYYSHRRKEKGRNLNLIWMEKI